MLDDLFDIFDLALVAPDVANDIKKFSEKRRGKAMPHQDVQTDLAGLDVRRDESMSKHTTFKVGGPADLFAEPTSVDDVVRCVAAAQKLDIPWRMLGCGSNVLVSDAGVRGLVIHLGEGFAEIQVEGNTIHAQAGATNKAVAAAALEAELAGYEFASGIPGSVGGAAIMNAGAYGGEFKDVCTRLTCLDLDGSVVELSAEEAAWGYRRSLMMERGLIVVGVVLQLTPGSRASIAAHMEDLQQQRETKQPLGVGSAGSTFKRPEGHFAGQLIEQAGMRGHTVGAAQVSDKHCGFVVNMGNATASDVLAVIHDVQEAVFKTSGVRLEPEVRIWE